MSQDQDYSVGELTSEQVLHTALEVFLTHFDAEVDEGDYTMRDVWNVLLEAVSQGSVEAACRALEEAPCGNTVRSYLQAYLLGDIDALEEMSNAALVSRLPDRIRGQAHDVGIDLHYIPYHGESDENEKELRRSKAKDGTTYFHCYASAYIIKHNKRVTVAVRYLRGDDTILDALKWLLERMAGLNIGCRELYLDRQFYSVPVIRYLKQRTFTSVMPAPVRGKRMRSLFTGSKSYRAQYTVSSQKYGSETVALYIIVSYAAGKRDKHGIDYLPYVVINGWPHTLRQLRERYRRRGGIETSYRLADSLRPRTTSRNPAYRLLLFTLGAILVNLWVFLKWAVLAIPRRGGRQIDQKIFPLQTFSTFLSRAVEAIYGVVTSVKRPNRTPQSAPT